MANSSNLWVLLGLSIAGIVIMTAKKLKKVIKEDFGAFIQRIQILPPPPPPAPPKAPHPLTGLNFAVSDVFDIDGYVTGFGNPDWAKTHEPAARTSPVILSVVEGGATCTGKTVLDEMALSISGVNMSYDTPTNPAAPAYIPGGASSGSAVAVSANLVEFSLDLILMDVTGFGNPDWAKTHEPAARTSPVILSVVEGGATCAGKTVLDEMALSISGVNMSYDTPTNPAAPAYIPGGASSGSAVAVSANLVEFSLVTTSKQQLIQSFFQRKKKIGPSPSLTPSSVDIESSLDSVVVDSPLDNVVAELPLDGVVVGLPLDNVVVELPLDSVVVEPPLDSVVAEPSRESVVAEPPFDGVVEHSPTPNIVNHDVASSSKRVRIEVEINQPIQAENIGVISSQNDEDFDLNNLPSDPGLRK